MSKFANPISDQNRYHSGFESALEIIQMQRVISVKKKLNRN